MRRREPKDKGRAFEAEGVTCLNLWGRREFGSFQNFPKREESFIFLIDLETFKEPS